MVEYRTALQLEKLIADRAGFDEKNIQVTPYGNVGNFRADFIGAAAGVSVFRARSDVAAVCRALQQRFRLQR